MCPTVVNASDSDGDEPTAAKTSDSEGDEPRADVRQLHSNSSSTVVTGNSVTVLFF